MKKEAIIRALILTVMLSLIAIQADTLDYPHTVANNKDFRFRRQPQEGLAAMSACSWSLATSWRYSHDQVTPFHPRSH